VILAFSTSCAYASVAAIDRINGVLWSGTEEAPQGAGGACLRMLDRLKAETGLGLQDAEIFASDIGPGSFTGVRVGVTLAKTFGFMYHKLVAGATSFDLISVESTVVLPSKKGEFFVRRPGSAPVRTVELPEEPFTGFGPGIETQVWPSAARFREILDRLEPVPAMVFAPAYLIEPSISIPKIPFPKLAEPGSARTHG